MICVDRGRGGLHIRCSYLWCAPDLGAFLSADRQGVLSAWHIRAGLAAACEHFRYGPEPGIRPHPETFPIHILCAKWHEPGSSLGTGNQNGRTANSLRRRCRLRADDGNLEPICWRDIPGWLTLPLGLRWIDIGCGNGAFTELLVERCSPVEVQGIDPSEARLAFARTRPASRLAKFQQGDAMALPFADSSFDAALMALVLVFVPDPAKGVSEMVRLVVPGGAVVTYMWDMLGNGFPLDPIYSEIQAMGVVPTRPPRMDASRMEALRDLWIGAGLEDVQAREIAVQRTFENFDDFWNTNLKSPALKASVWRSAVNSRSPPMNRHLAIRPPKEAMGHTAT
ncbi:SAM-dependent methyltransferase [Bradyrhizobium sp. LB7.2]